MDNFTRRFAVEHLVDHRHDGGLAALFERWVLPGEDAGTHGLRVAIRNGYLNFYVKGQSVGELRTLAGWPRLKLHRKYRMLARAGSADAAAIGQQYDIVNSDTLMATSSDIVDGWIDTAESHAGDEKRFVDDLVAVTPGTLDLEMGLPALDGSTGEDRTAPRMDLVVAQGSDIAFWEAKCAVNGELRARAAYVEDTKRRYVAGPHVLWQLRRYQHWFGSAGRDGQVRQAYLETARILIALAEMFGKRGAAVEAWRRLLAAGDGASVILPPGIVIADYCPSRAEADDYRAKTNSFAQHAQRLEQHGATILQVASKPSGALLPDLKPGSIGLEPQF